MAAFVVIYSFWTDFRKCPKWPRVPKSAQSCPIMPKSTQKYPKVPKSAQSAGTCPETEKTEMVGKVERNGRIVPTGKIRKVRKIHNEEALASKAC